MDEPGLLPQPIDEGHIGRHRLEQVDVSGGSSEGGYDGAGLDPELIREGFRRVARHYRSRNVSHTSIWPDLNPVWNHWLRCCEVPWVNASGCTAPPPIR